MKIYTKTGDDGTTGTLVSGRLSKSHPLFKVMGKVGTLNACIGKLEVYANAFDNEEFQLSEIQNVLFEIGTYLARLGSGNLDLTNDIESLEQGIDDMTSTLPVLKNFILPGGNSVASEAFYISAVCREAEQCLWEFIDYYPGASLSSDKSECQRTKMRLHYKEVGAYLNRLSDYFFTLARYLNFISGYPEVIWTSRDKK